jgi:hypothetical protein
VEGGQGLQSGKVRVLCSLRLVGPEDVMLGQYKAGGDPGYLGVLQGMVCSRR